MQLETKNKMARIWYELNALDKGTICLSELSEELQVTVRTLQRDMNTIDEAEFPIYCPRPGYYAFVEGFRLEKAQISSEEASILVVMNEVAHALGTHFDASFKQLKQRLMQTPGINPFFIKLTGTDTYPNTQLTRTLETCIRSREKVTVCYQGGQRACYPVRPLKLLWVEGFWYLLALTDDEKLLKFRLEKITSVTPLGQTFPSNKNIERLMREGTNIWFDLERPLHAELEVSAQCAKYFEQKKYFPLQQIVQKYPDGRVRLTCQAARAEEILPTILHWLPHIKVLQPQPLQQQLKEVLTSYLRSLS